MYIISMHVRTYVCTCAIEITFCSTVSGCGINANASPLARCKAGSTTKSAVFVRLPVGNLR